MNKECLFSALNLKTKFCFLESKTLTVWAYHLQSLLTIGLLMLLFLCACSQTPTHHQKFTSSQESTLPNFRIVKHQMGETKLPISPKRVVVLDGALTEAVLALSVKPVGAPVKFINYPLSQMQQAGIEDIGARTPNLEKILALKPDLILGLSDNQEMYGLLSHIAPTVLINYSYSTWKEMFLSVAQALGQTTVAKQWMSQYYNRIFEFKASMGNRLALTHISVLRIAGYTMFIKGSFFGGIFNDIGLLNSLSQNLDVLTFRRNIFTNGYVYVLSPELLNEADGDALFLISDTSFGLASAQKAREQLQVQPLWSKLKAAQQRKVYIVGSYWVCCGPLAANRVLDDLSKYLLETSHLK
ncbi:MAG: iron-siderophore ABC transporter substrate-binding protein [Nostoc sp.]|uniref:ABC transporter substrate-binding protein n=1 Tax=Nostoc sp. TaxID=1180 RepID=UPI002FF568C1